MSENHKKSSVDIEQAKQRELVELRRKKQEFEQNPENFVPEPATETFVQSRRSKISNFWFYWKKTIFGLTLVAIILAVGITQCATRKKYDMTVVLYIKHYITTEMVENVAMVLEQYCEDYNGDGEVNVLVMDCSVTDEERLLETGRVKSTRLMAQFASEEAIVYIVDKKALEELDTIANGVFVDDSLGLPEYDGKAYALNGSSFDLAFNDLNENYSENFEYYLIRRVTEGTAIDGKGDVDIHSERGNKIIASIIAEPNRDDNLKEKFAAKREN